MGDLYNSDNQIEKFFGWYYVNMIKHKYNMDEKNKVRELIYLFYKLINYYQLANSESKIQEILTDKEKKMLEEPKFNNYEIIKLDDKTKLVFELKKNSQISYVKVIGRDIDTSIFYNIKEKRYLFFDDAVDVMLDKKLVTIENSDVKIMLKEIDEFYNEYFLRSKLLYLVSMKIISSEDNYDLGFFKGFKIYYDFKLCNEDVNVYICNAIPYLSINCLETIRSYIDWNLDHNILNLIDEVIKMKKQNELRKRLTMKKKELVKRLVRDFKIIRDRKLEEK